jgi:uncharacterized membrane protein
MNRWLFRRRTRDAHQPRTATQDAEVARLTAKADLIMDELESVVGQMADMLREAHGADND